MSKSVPVRRSERIKARQRDEGEKSSTPTISRGHEHSTRSSKSKKSRQELVRIEMEITKKKMELQHQQEILDLELAKKLAIIEDESSVEEDSGSVKCESEERPNVSKWVNGKCPWDIDRSETHSLKKSGLSKVGANISSNSQIPSIFTTEKMLTRWSMNQDLPIFSGDPTEWPNFIFQYKNTTDICGFSMEENHCRLQKSLKGYARKIVESLLIMPRNVDKIIEILESRFGRPEHIIFMLLDKIKGFPAVKEDRLDMFINFSDEIKNLVGTIEVLNQVEHLQNPILLQELVNKLPTSYKLNWIEYISNKTTINYKLVEFCLWMDKKASFACQIQTPKMTFVKNDIDSNKMIFGKNDFDRNITSRIGKGNQQKGVTLSTGVIQNRKMCNCCNKEAHHLSKCLKFESLSIDERWKFVTSNKMCFSCLLSNHFLKTCRKVKKCDVDSCTKPHHKLLHKNGDQLPVNISQNFENKTADEINFYVSTNKHVLLKILPVVICKGVVSVHTYALLDDASTVTLMDEDLANELELDGPQHSLCIQWTNNQRKEQEDSRIVSCHIKAPNGRKTFRLRHVRTFRGMSLPEQTVDIKEIERKYPYLISDKECSLFNAKPRLLIGQDNWPLLVNKKMIAGPWNGPALSKTLLGWVIHGNVSTDVHFPNSPDSQVVCHISHGEKDDLDILHDLVKEQWQIDNYGIDKKDQNSTKSLSKQDKQAQEILDQTMRRVGERYETGLLWKDTNLILPESKSNAEKRLLCTERKMNKNHQFGQSYCNKMLDLENKGYIRKLTEDEAKETNSKTWYLPHFGVFNPNKPNKLRIVFDAASKSNGVSLNDCLHTGPDLYNSLFDILLNFRIKKYAFVADIKEMFLQVQVRPEDRNAQRFLWRAMDRQKIPEVYEICVVFFGSTSGPCLAQEAKNRNALEFMETHPKAVKDIIHRHYMDDYLGNADTEEEAKQLIKDVIFVHGKAGFQICNWISNFPEVLTEIDQTLTTQTDKNENIPSEITIERILGTWWNPNTDNFEFQTKFHKIHPDILEKKKHPTKREVLKVVMSIFDPLSFLSNFIIQGKILLQDIWRNNIDWDEEIPSFLIPRWNTWLDDIKHIFKFKIPRQYFSLDRNHSKIQLHIFSDASDKCYSAVAYLRIQENTEIQTAFITSKAKVAPLKPLSIPRLELQAAVIGARLGHSIRKSLDLNISNIFYWTDSKTVLHWIRTEAQRFKVFIAQRIGEIQDLTNPTEWRYVPSKQNVADEATKRNTDILNFSSNSTWLWGPKFLKYEYDEWPKEINEKIELTKKEQENMEFRNENYFVNIITKNFDIIDPGRFSKWNRLRRTIAWSLRFIENCKGNIRKGELRPEEIHNAEIILFKKVQTDSFYEELQFLKEDKPLNKTSRLYTFSCRLDENDIIRLGGRLENSKMLSEYTKRPIILDNKHRITKLLIKEYHEESCHQGTETVINNLRQKFWILHIREAVKSVRKDCQRCKNKKATPKIPIMGQLPNCRLEPTIRCFVKTGVDYFGPFYVAVKRSREKRYGVIFTCMTTRAVHLEIAHDLSTDGFIHILRQFGCRRGFPEEMYSDNGTNFKSADKELSTELQKLKQTDIVKFCTMKNIKWFFNPPLAPNMGGAWERLIQSIKKIIGEILVSKCPQEYVLRTVFIEAENIINSRPLTHVSIDSEDSEALTPNHFLIGSMGQALPCTDTDQNFNLYSKWRAAQKLIDYFWKRWLHEYMPYLVKRHKWYKESGNIQLGDVVVVIDPNGPRNVWLKGKVIRLYPANDGRIRIVDVQLANGTTLRRPVSKLCVLDVDRSS